MSQSATTGRTWVNVSVRLDWRVDVTDWLEKGEEPTENKLQQLAHDKLDYHEHQNGDEAECVGYGRL